MAAHWLLLRNRFSEKKILADLRDEVDRLVTDLGREADRDVELLEGRIRQLRDAMAEADQKMLLFSREETKRERASAMERTLSTPREGKAPAAEAFPSPGTASARVAPERETKTEPKKDEPIMVYTKPMITRRDRQIEPVIPLGERVLDMARKGISADMIASTLGMSLGEVELIIDMNRSSL